MRVCKTLTLSSCLFSYRAAPGLGQEYVSWMKEYAGCLVNGCRLSAGKIISLPKLGSCAHRQNVDMDGGGGRGGIRKAFPFS